MRIPEAEKPFVIYDRLWHNFCTLPGGADGQTPLPLEWRTRFGAEAWLSQCRMAWLTGKAPEPEGAGATIYAEQVREGWGTKTVRRWI